VGQTNWGESEIRGPVHLFRERLLLRHFRRWLPRGCVLDAGCGSGSLALDLCRMGYQVNAVEDSASFVELVAQRGADCGLSPRLAAKQGSVTRLDYADATFDGLVCGEVLEHVLPADGGDTAAVTEFARVLRPGGICALSVPLNPRLWDHTDEWAKHVKRYRREELMGLMAAAGFDVLVTRSWGFPLGRLYHRMLFAPWVRRTAGQSVAQREARADTRAGRSPALIRWLALVLRLDEMWGRWPWGRGIVLVAGKPDQGATAGGMA
jgi:2-polyprenyl-3-methyl-5-hydroxy-6-metoxy-1,4-benzoquinol methylase